MILDRSALLAKLLTSLPTNGNRLITAEALRELLADFVESQFNLTDDGVLLNPPDISGKLNRSGDTMEGPLVLAGDPGSALGAATKQYVDELVSQAINGVNYKNSARAVVVDRAGPLAPLMSGTYTTLDGVALQVGDRVVVNSTLNATLNGIYVVASGTWQRATDADTGSELRGATLLIEEGTSFGDKILITTNNGPITIGSTNITWAVIGQAISYTAGSGLALSGNQFSVDGTVMRRVITPGSQTGNVINMDLELQTRATVSGTPEAISITSLTNTGIGKSIRLRLSSANTGDSFSIAVSGQTIRQIGYSFVPGQLHFIDLAQVGASEWLCAIIPIV